MQRKKDSQDQSTGSVDNLQNEIRDFFEDVLKNVNIPSLFTNVKIIRDKNNGGVRLESTNKSKTVILNAIMNHENSWITDTFGLGDMNRLESLLNHPYFQIRDRTRLEINYREEGSNRVPVEISILNPQTRTHATHRFLSKEFIGDARFKGVAWDLEGEIDSSKRNEIFSFSQIERNENFMLYVDGDDLLLGFGKPGGSTHSLTLVLLPGCSKHQGNPLGWETNDFLSVLRNIPSGESTNIKISWRGILLLERETKLGKYQYILRSTGIAG